MIHKNKKKEVYHKIKIDFDITFNDSASQSSLEGFKQPRYDCDIYSMSSRFFNSIKFSRNVPSLNASINQTKKRHSLEKESEEGVRFDSS